MGCWLVQGMCNAGINIGWCRHTSATCLPLSLLCCCWLDCRDFSAPLAAADAQATPAPHSDGH
jgi:hypothetical protein